MTDTRPRRGLKRRGLLLAGGAAAATALGAGAIWGSSAFADSAAGGRFDLKTGAQRFLREKAIHDGTVLQSFAFDNVNKHIYFVQVTAGSDPKKGYLTVTKVDPTGKQLGYMYLRGFGHGVSIGVEPAGSAAYLWTETDANPDSGYGRAITRFKFVNKQTLTYGSSSLKLYRPVSGSTSNQPSVDMLNKRIALRYRKPGGMHYSIFNLADVIGGKFTPLYTFSQVGIQDGEVFQGFCLHGDYVYQLVGTCYTSAKGTNPPAGHGNTYVSSINVTTGKLIQRSRTEAAYSLSYREPEGMAVELTSPPKLHMGFASGASGARKYSLYYKPQA